jgi:hypothetical protein
MVLRQVVEDEPRPPRRLNDRVPRDLEVICLKCLEKDAARRYTTAGALADDLRRYLEGRPIQARPVGRAERLARWCRRNPEVAGSIAAVALATALGFAGVSWQLQETKREKARAEENFRVARKAVSDFLITVNKSAALRRDLPGLHQFRADLLAKALDYLRKFLREHGNDRDLRSEVGEAYYQVAMVTEQIGSKDDALAASKSALAIYEPLARAHPFDPALEERLAETSSQLGSLQLQLN